MKLPIPQELIDKLDSTEAMMGQIVEGLQTIAVKLDELIEIERGKR